MRAEGVRNKQENGLVKPIRARLTRFLNRIGIKFPVKYHCGHCRIMFYFYLAVSTLYSSTMLLILADTIWYRDWHHLYPVVVCTWCVFLTLYIGIRFFIWMNENSAYDWVVKKFSKKVDTPE